MKTRRFIEIVESALQAMSPPGEDGAEFITVYFDNEGRMDECLGILFEPNEHMARVVAVATTIVCDWEGSTLESVSNELHELSGVIALMEVAPYMQWTCVYFPGVTQSHVDNDLDVYEELATPEAEPIEHPAKHLVSYETEKELDAMLDVGEIDQEQHDRAVAWCRAHPGDVAAWRGSLKYGEIADTALSLSAITKEQPNG